MFYSLSGEQLEIMVLTEIAESSDVTDNDINLLSSQEDFDFGSILGNEFTIAEKFFSSFICLEFNPL